MDDVQQRLVNLGGGDRFGDVLEESKRHQREHGCALFPAGPAVMQLASMFVRAANPRTVLDLGCGIGYSTFWLADASAPGATVIGINRGDRINDAPLDGFVSANIHRSHDSRRVVNDAQSASIDAFNAMREHPDAKSHMQRCAELADSFDPVICTVRHTAS